MQGNPLHYTMCIVYVFYYIEHLSCYFHIFTIFVTSCTKINNYVLPRLMFLLFYCSSNIWKWFRLSIARRTYAFFCMMFASTRPMLRNIVLLWESYFYGGLERGMWLDRICVCVHTQRIESWVVNSRCLYKKEFFRESHCRESPSEHDVIDLSLLTTNFLLTAC